MLGSYRVRTDLAVESKEKFEKDNVEIKGVEIHEDYEENLDLRTTIVKIVSDSGAKIMEKPKGVYITMEAPNLVVPDEDYHREISVKLAQHLSRIIGLETEKSVLVVGLGNRDITPDALGPRVVSNLRITRHIIKEYGKAGMGRELVHTVSSLVPGVMAQTGMETMEIIRGVIEETKPDVMIAIDALAARSMKRLNCTIQITDTGINPGSGVLNFRNGLNEEALGIPVIGIGVPTVVDAATIVHDAVSHLLDSLEEAEMEDFLAEVITPKLHSMFVTPKDVDETVKMLSYTISEGLNLAMNAYDKDRK
jgi:spore protease